MISFGSFCACRDEVFGKGEKMRRFACMFSFFFFRNVFTARLLLSQYDLHNDLLFVSPKEIMTAVRR